MAVTSPSGQSSVSKLPIFSIEPNIRVFTVAVVVVVVFTVAVAVTVEDWLNMPANKMSGPVKGCWSIFKFGTGRKP